MNKKEISAFHDSIDHDKKIKLLDDYLNGIKYTEKFVQETTKWLAILVFFYYLLTNNLLEEIVFSGAKFNKLEFVEKYFPFAASCLIFMYTLAAIHKGRCIKIYESLFRSVYCFKDNLKTSIPFLTTIVLPFGFYRGLENREDNGCLSQFFYWVFSSPLLVIQILPYIFIVDSLKKIYCDYWGEPYIQIVFYSSIWFVLSGIVVFLHFLIKSIRQELSEF